MHLSFMVLREKHIDALINVAAAPEISNNWSVYILEYTLISAHAFKYLQ